jgi:hypothetical protein
MVPLGRWSAQVAVVAANVLIMAGCAGTPDSGKPSTGSPSVPREPGPTTGTATIAIRAEFVGTPPVMPVIRVGGDPVCVSKHTNSPLLRENIVVNPDGTLRDVVVRIKGGLEAYQWSVEGRDPAVITQDGCRFDPHVSSLMAGQAIEFRNDDATIHNVNGQPVVNDKFNFSMTSDKVPPRQVTFAHPEWPPVRIKCDVHPWMVAYAAVLDHPFHGVTGTSGTAELRRLPAGQFVVEAWHRELGSFEKKVDLADGQTATLDFQFSAKPE